MTAMVTLHDLFIGCVCRGSLSRMRDVATFINLVDESRDRVTAPQPCILNALESTIVSKPILLLHTLSSYYSAPAKAPSSPHISDAFDGQIRGC